MQTAPRNFIDVGHGRIELEKKFDAAVLNGAR